MQSDVQTGRLTPPINDHDHTQGSPDPVVTLTEYADYQCPYCETAERVIKQVQSGFGSGLRFAFRNYPLVQAHPFAEIAAEAAEAAGAQGKFWDMHDLLFENQRHLDPDHLLRYAETLSLDLDRFQSDLEQHRHHKKIVADYQSGEASGVPGTPAYFINDVLYEGSPDADSLLRALQQAAGSEQHQ